MERPALLELLDEIKAGRVDVVVVYKIDRLTRSLMDFAKIVDVFDGHDVSFVSVTQQFNTTTSMGRLTLNVLLSFAQFEREVTAERIRDKIAASKKKGMWMGGPSPLGYDAIDKQLVVNEIEAETVRHLFKLYLETGSVRRLKERADELGILTKHRRRRDGSACGNKPFSRGNLYLLLSNPIYIGRVVHHGETFDGKHDAIIDHETWDDVQNMIASNAVERCSSSNTDSPSILTGLIFDETGDRLSPSHAVKEGVRYRYYISHRLMEARRKASDGWRVPAREIERPVISTIVQHLTDELKFMKLLDVDDLSPDAYRNAFARSVGISKQLNATPHVEQKELLKSILHRIELHPDKLVIEINPARLWQMLEVDVSDTNNTKALLRMQRIELSHKLKRRGLETKIVIGSSDARDTNPDQNLIMTVANAHRWLHLLTNGDVTSIDELATNENIDRNEVSRFLPLAFLAPDIVQKILDGRQPVDLTIRKLRNIEALPMNWASQHDVLGFGPQS